MLPDYCVNHVPGLCPQTPNDACCSRAHSVARCARAIDLIARCRSWRYAVVPPSGEI